MHQATSKQRQLVRRIVVYSVMVISVITLVTILVLLMLGYRFNKTSNSLQQGGLVQFISRPSGATISIGSANLSNKTPTKITVNPGEYMATMSRKDYRSWSKMTEVRAGQVLWLNYAQLVPNTIETKQVLGLGDATDAMASNDGKMVAYFVNGKPQTLRVASIDTNNPTVKDISLPESLIGAKATVAPKLQYWSKDDDALLATISVAGKTQWLYIDRNTPANSQNISTTYDLALQTVRFDPRSNSRVVAHTSDGDVRTIDVSNGTLSAVLATNVSKFSLFGNKHLLYIYINAEKLRTLGYLTLGEKTGRDLPMVASDAQLIAGDEYFDTAYISVVSNKMQRVYRFADLPNSAAKVALSSSLVFSSPISGIPLFSSFHNSGRFVIVQSKTGYTTYDIELERYTNTKFGNTQSQEVHWLDGYHVYYENAGKLNVAEFDGANSYQIGPANGWMASLLNDGKYLYTTVKTANGYSIQRSKMIVD